jgi:F-type H+-transporting ATPase subunit b
MLSARRLSNAYSIGKRRDPLTRSPSTPPQMSLTTGASDDRLRVVRTLLAAAVTAWLVCLAPSAGLAAVREAAPAAAPAAPAVQAVAAPTAPQGEPGPGAVPAEPRAGEGTGGHGEGEAEQAESPWATAGRLFNFAMLVGLLVYLLRSPLMGYLDQRGADVRSGLARAKELREDAAAQIGQIEARLRALPAEIAALKRRGAEEIAAEEVRIRNLAEAERQRLLDHATRDIETQVRVAERELRQRTAELAVAVAIERVTRTMTDRDQARLVERYVAQVRQ